VDVCCQTLGVAARMGVAGVYKGGDSMYESVKTWLMRFGVPAAIMAALAVAGGAGFKW